MDAIVTEHLTKTYRVGIGRARVREMMPPPVDHAVERLFPNWWNRDTFNALQDLSIAIESGTSVGIVGHNGAGKTTLLKILAEVTAPTKGSVKVSGRVAALIDVMVGFHPDLTGRENVYLLSAMLGYGRRAVSGKIEEILEFADIGELIDTPLKRFSAGMVSRIGFATITALDIDVLLVDEVLAVGDANFQRKCIRWLEGYRARGGTLLFVSHNLALVRNMTDRVFWLDHGKLVGDGSTSSVLADYGKAMERRDFSDAALSRGEVRKVMAARGLNRYGAGGARVGEVHFGQPKDDGSELHVTISYEATDLDEALFCVGFIDESGREVGSASSPLVHLTRGEGSVGCQITPLPLRDGVYFPFVAILSGDGIVRDRWRLDRAVAVDRRGSMAIAGEFGPVDIAATWSNGDGHA
jgi:ABC-type polysaccharide/polyol phosphate transport system ATPase subunit